MTEQVSTYSGRRFFFFTAVPIFFAAVALCLGAVLFLRWSERAIDTTSIMRQGERVEIVMRRLRSDLVREQEAATARDEAVVAVHDPKMIDWVDTNLGAWLHDYFGHDAAYIVDAENQPVYAAIEGRKVAPAHYDRIRESAAPLIAKIREALRPNRADAPRIPTRAPSIAEFGLDHGHPALISISPIVSYTGKPLQRPGSEYLHLAVRRLDGNFFADIGARNRLRGLTFSPQRAVLPVLESLPLRTLTGTTFGYAIWRPVRPGNEVLEDVSPVIFSVLGATLVFLIGALVLVHRHHLASSLQEARIQHLVRHDALTDLPNRSEFHPLLDQVLGDPTSREGALLYIDIDHLKEINASLGHATGDAVVREAGRRIAEAARGRAIACRLDSDEFGLIATGADALATEALCDDILEAFRAPITIDDDLAFVGVSIGVVRFPQHGIESSELLHKADVAMHLAKIDGRGRATLFNAQLGTMLLERAKLEQDLRVALRDFSGISVHYQPVFRAKDRKLVAAEALARWNHPQLGWVSPAQFIPIAESSNLIKRLGAHVLRIACRAAAGWSLDTIAVNVSVVQLRDPTFVATVRAALEDSDLPPARLELEITESTLIEDNTQCAENLRQLRALGVRIALDDFGTGFSTFGRLQGTEAVDRIKIDQSFVKGSGETKGDKAIVRAIVDLARAKGIRTTAEGVETPESAEFLTRIGCDELQGYLFARPMPHDEAAAMIRTCAPRAIPE